MDVEIGVVVAIDFEGEDNGEAIQVFSHGEAAFLFPSPDLWSYVIIQCYRATGFVGEAFGVEFFCETEVEARVVDEADGLGFVLTDPGDSFVKEVFKERVIFEDFEKADDGAGGEVKKEVGARALEFGTAESVNGEVGVALLEVFKHVCGMLVP